MERMQLILNPSSDSGTHVSATGTEPFLGGA
jgi:hypothetical protein